MALAKKPAMPPADEPGRIPSIYESDFHAWAMEQAALIRHLAPQGLDVENLAEEIESLGRSERREVKRRMVVLLTHLIKYKYQPEKRKGGWEASVRVQRRDLKKVLFENPSLRSLPAEALEEAYEDARYAASMESFLVLEDITSTCPFAIEQVMDDDFFGD